MLAINRSGITSSPPPVGPGSALLIVWAPFAFASRVFAYTGGVVGVTSRYTGTCGGVVGVTYTSGSGGLTTQTLARHSGLNLPVTAPQGKRTSSIILFPITLYIIMSQA